MPDTHARFSPSAANRRIHCPPSLLLEEQFEEGESVYAAEGTAGHALAEHLIRKHLKQRTTRPTSEYYKDELLEAVDEYVSFVIGEIEDARRECHSPVLLVEQRIDASEYVDGCFGTKWAFNANFERVCLSRYLGMPNDEFLDPAQWHCTMIWSAYLGLPLSLMGVGAALALDKQKLSEGKELIRYFCQPCAATKANGGRTRNLPQDAPEKWTLFKAYNLRDVETEMGIQKRLRRYPVPEDVWAQYHQDQAINDRGIAIDRQLVESAIQMDMRSRAELTEQMQKLTCLENPNSVQQMKKWLAEHDVPTESLGKKQVAALLKDCPEDLREVLILRQQLAKSSVKKYIAMRNAACADGRVRGAFQFYGANRSGRWAGRNVQLQNLPQNHMEELAEARACVRRCDYEAVEQRYGSVPDVLSELIRTAFIPSAGRKLIVSDFSAVEARVIACAGGYAQNADGWCSPHL